MVKNILFFVLAILLTFILLPNISIYLRPNLILIFLISLYLKIGFAKSIWFWVAGGIILDSLNAISFPINTILFISFFVISFLFKNIFEYETLMSKIITGFIFISIYFLSFILRDLIVYNGFFINYEYFRQFFITFIIFAIIWIIKSKQDEKTL